MLRWWRRPSSARLLSERIWHFPQAFPVRQNSAERGLPQADSLLRLQAPSTAAPRGAGLSGTEADRFDQLPESCLVSATAGLPPLFSPAGADAILSLDGGPGVPHSGVAQVHEVGRRADERTGHLALLFAPCGDDGYGSGAGCVAAAVGAACPGGTEDVDANGPGARAL